MAHPLGGRMAHPLRGRPPPPLPGGIRPCCWYHRGVHVSTPSLDSVGAAVVAAGPEVVTQLQALLAAQDVGYGLAWSAVDDGVGYVAPTFQGEPWEVGVMVPAVPGWTIVSALWVLAVLDHPEASELMDSDTIMPFAGVHLSGPAAALDSMLGGVTHPYGVGIHRIGPNLVQAYDCDDMAIDFAPPEIRETMEGPWLMKLLQRYTDNAAAQNSRETLQQDLAGADDE